MHVYWLCAIVVVFQILANLQRVRAQFLSLMDFPPDTRTSYSRPHSVNTPAPSPLPNKKLMEENRTKVSWCSLSLSLSRTHINLYVFSLLSLLFTNFFSPIGCPRDTGGIWLVFEKAWDSRLCQVDGYNGSGQVSSITLSWTLLSLFKQSLWFTGGGVDQQNDQLWWDMCNNIY